MQLKLKKKHGTKCNHNCNMSHKPIPLPLFGKSKSRQCFVKTTKCSIKYYLCQNLSATEKVSENASLEMNPSLLNHFQISVIAIFITLKIKG